jgi:hypothetical protein
MGEFPQSNPGMDGPKPLRRRWLRRAGLALIILLLIASIPLIWLCIKVHRGRQVLERRLPEERTWWLSQWREVPDEDNRYFAYKAIDERIKDNGGSTYTKCFKGLFKYEFGPEDVGERWPADDKALLKLLAERAGDLSELEAALQKPGFRLPPTYLDMPNGKMPMHFRNLLYHQYLDKILMLNAWHDLRDGRRQEGGRRLILLIRNCADSSYEGGIIGEMIGLADIHRVAIALFDTTSDPAWTATELRSLADGLQTEMDRFSTMADSLRRDRLELFLIADAFDNGRAGGFKVNDKRVRFGGRELLMGLARYDTMMQQVINAHSLPNPQRKIILDELDRQIEGEKKGILNWIDPGNRHAGESYGIVPSTVYDHCLTRFNVLIAALRMRAAQIETGRFPSSMAQLALINNRPVPMDLVMGTPLSVVSNSAGITWVYCFGYDNADDGGYDFHLFKLRPELTIPPNARKTAPPKSTYTGDDFAFELHPVNSSKP